MHLSKVNFSDRYNDAKTNLDVFFPTQCTKRLQIHNPNMFQIKLMLITLPCDLCIPIRIAIIFSGNHY